MTKRVFLLAVLFFLATLVGCEAINTGPKMVGQVIEGATGVGRDILAKSKVDEMFAASEGQAVNPEFYVTTFAGTGVYVHTTFGLTGADVSYDLTAKGTGVEGPLPPEIQLQVLEVWNNGALSVTERERLVFELIRDYLIGEGVLSPVSGEGE